LRAWPPKTTRNTGNREYWNEKRRFTASAALKKRRNARTINDLLQLVSKQPDSKIRFSRARRCFWNGAPGGRAQNLAPPD
jgi:hypothetical protein